MNLLHEDVEYALDWLCQKAERVLDFGCGDGEMLHMCAKRGTKIHLGIDSSPMLITKAIRRTDKSKSERFYYRCGKAAEFITLLDRSFDAVILSDVLDLLNPDDGAFVLAQAARVLDKKGKMLVKLGAYVSPEQASLRHANQASIALWNLTTEQWSQILSADFVTKDFKNVYYKDNDIHERMFLLLRPDE